MDEQKWWERNTQQRLEGVKGGQAVPFDYPIYGMTDEAKRIIKEKQNLLLRIWEGR